MSANSIRKAIVMAGGCGTRLAPCTNVISKHLLPVYNKPMIYYPLSTLQQVGIQQVLLLSHQPELELYKQLLQDAKQWDMTISYDAHPRGQGIGLAMLQVGEFLAGESFVLMLGDNFFYGQAFLNLLKQCMSAMDVATIFALPVARPERFGVVQLDQVGMPVSIIEKPVDFISDLVVPGCYCYDASVVQIAEQLAQEMTDFSVTEINQHYLQCAKLQVKKLPADTIWYDMGTFEDLSAAAQFVRQQQLT